MNTRILMLVAGVLLFATSSFGYEDEAPNTQSLEIPFTPPDKALSWLELPDGFKASLFANEPNVIQPIAATTDSRGRLWVVECLTYSDRKQNYDLALHDRVIILEDTDNDGAFDSRKIFWDQGQKLTGIELGFGGVWLTSAPNLLFLADEDGDDHPDGPPKVLLDGFNGDEIRHNIVNGLRWGPDGWLYGRHGIQATSHVGKQGASSSQRTAINCSIWRFHPESHQFQVVAEGGTNPWGWDFDDYGEMFMINTVIGHMFHIVPGARYRRMYGAHFNPHTYQMIEQTADHYHWDRSEAHWEVNKKEGMSSGTDAAGGGHAHTGLMCYLGDNWPDEYRNKWFTANFHGRRINVERVERQLCGFTARHESDMIKTKDPWFRGVEMLYGPDGGVYLLDWSDIGECHEDDGIHRTSGRIFKITYGDTGQPEKTNLATWSAAELVNCNSHDNQWFVRHARRVLHERKAAGEDMTTAIGLLKQFIKSQQATLDKSQVEFDSRPTLRALWALHSIDGADETYLLQLAGSANENIAAWAIRLLVEDSNEISGNVKSKFTDLASHSPSGLVRLYLASALNRFDLSTDFEIYRALTQHESDIADRTQQKLVWYRLEPHVLQHWQVALKLISETKFPLIRENIARRIVSEIDSQPHATAGLIQLLKDERSDIVLAVARGMQLALEGRTRVEKPTGWDDVFSVATTRHSDSDLESAITKELKQVNVIFGDGRGIEELRKLAADNSVRVEIRRRAIIEYSATRPDGLFDFLKPLIRNHSVANSVIKSMVYTDHPDAADQILNRFGHFDPQGKALAVETLTSRKVWASRLLDAVQKKRLPKTAISAQIARQIANFEDDQLIKKLNLIWGKIRKSEEDKLQDMDRIRELCQADEELEGFRSKARYQVGKKLFAEKCATCHVIYGRGENVGPDLTGGDRKNLNYLLENIIDPSASVASSFRATKFLLEDGRVLSGVVLQKTAQVTRVQTATEVVILENKNIEESKPTELSLMPEGLLQNMADDEVRALFYFLRNDP